MLRGWLSEVLSQRVAMPRHGDRVGPRTLMPRRTGMNCGLSAARPGVSTKETSERSTCPRRAASAITASIRAGNTPASRHWRNLSQTVHQGPNSSGISRHWLPVRNRRTTPSNWSRSRCGCGPYSPIGSNGSTNTRSSSPSSRLATRRFYRQTDHDSAQAIG